MKAHAAGPGALFDKGWFELEYNERPYNDRGWCSFEGSVSIELIARLSKYPKMQALLNSLPPKLLSLSAERSAEPVAWDAHADGGRHVEHAVRCIEDATFTGKGDKPMVVQLYKNYVGKIVDALQHTLALGASGDAAEADATSDQRTAPMLPIPPAFGICLEPGQLVEATRAPSDRRDGSGGGMLVAVVGADGRTAEGAVGGEHLALSIEHCSQAVLPWRPTAEDGWEAALRCDLDALRAVDARMQQLRIGCAAAADETQVAAAVVEAAEAVLEQLTAAGATAPLARCAEAVRDVMQRAVPSGGAEEAATHDPAASLEAVVGSGALAAIASEVYGACGARAAPCAKYVVI